MDVPLLVLALSLGAASAISPGPLLVLVVSTTVRRGFLAGLRISVAPLITDAPILAIGVLTLNTLPPAALGGISVTGGVFLVVLGAREALHARRAELPRVGATETEGERELLRGVVVNLLNPNPWLFLLTVMAPLLALTWPRSPASAVGFVIVFYLVLVGGKIALAGALTRLRPYISARLYRGVLILAGLLLCAIGASLAWLGWTRLAGA